VFQSSGVEEEQGDTKGKYGILIESRKRRGAANQRRERRLATPHRVVYNALDTDPSDSGGRGQPNEKAVEAVGSSFDP